MVAIIGNETLERLQKMWQKISWLEDEHASDHRGEAAFALLISKLIQTFYAYLITVKCHQSFVKDRKIMVTNITAGQY